MSRIERDCERRLRSSAAGHDVTLATSVVQRRPWSSALFAGIRLTMQVEGHDDTRLDAWLIALPDLDLPLPGYFVANADVVERSAGAATLELLMIED